MCWRILWTPYNLNGVEQFVPSGSKLGQCHPATVTWMFCLSYKWEWNILPFDFMYPGENIFSHSLKILGQTRCFLGPKSPILSCYACISFAMHQLILVCSLPQNSRAEIIPACVHPKSSAAHRTAVVLLNVGISTLLGGRALGRTCVISAIKYKYIAVNPIIYSLDMASDWEEHLVCHMSGAKRVCFCLLFSHYNRREVQGLKLKCVTKGK